MTCTALTGSGHLEKPYHEWHIKRVMGHTGEWDARDAVGPQVRPRPPAPPVDVRECQPDVRTHTCRVFTCDVTLACCGVPRIGFGEVERRLRLLDRRFSRFRADSEVSLLNANAGTWWSISPEMHALLEHALHAAVASGGLVNIAVLPQLRAAGYRSSTPEADSMPWETENQSAAAPLTSVVELRRHEARLSPGSAVDFGALAKGLWADQVVSWLGPNSAASLGGDVSCRGDGPGEQGWPVAVSGGEVLRVSDGAVATSGTAKRRWGAGLHHLIDPRTGRPSQSDVRQATVIANAGGTAEWVSSALVVGGTPVVDRLTGRPDVLDWRLVSTEERR